MDWTLPGDPITVGTRHPISLVRNRIIQIFGRLGFSVAEGPEIEDDWHNFTALNLPEDHPARDMQDTFYVTQKSRLAAAHAYQQCAGAGDGKTKTTHPDYLSGPCVQK